MSEQIKNGGSAFPVMLQDIHSGEWMAITGMTLRDYFAAKAMHAELVTCGTPGEACDALIEAAGAAGRTPEQQVAWNAYRMADAMLSAREATP